jgi:hypothetical protein
MPALNAADPSAYAFRVLWPTAWADLLHRMQVADELIGRIAVLKTSSADLLLIECEAAEDQMILDACVQMQRPPAF